MERLERRAGNRRRAVAPEPGAEPATRPPIADATATGSVQVISGASVQSFALAGLQVAHACRVLGTILQVDRDAPVLVNGRPVRPTYRLASGDTLELVRHAGEKGGGYGRPGRDRRGPRRV